MQHPLKCNTFQPAFEGHICGETDKVLNLNKFQSIKNLSTKNSSSTEIGLNFTPYLNMYLIGEINVDFCSNAEYLHSVGISNILFDFLH
jgi:hypothetical protein